MKKSVVHILLLVHLLSWVPDLWARGPDGARSTGVQRTAAARHFMRMRVPYARPSERGFTRAMSGIELNGLAQSIHRFLPDRSQRQSTSGVSQILETGQLIITHSSPGAAPVAIRELVDAANTLVMMSNPTVQTVLVAPNPFKVHAEGAGEVFAEVHGNLTISTQGSSRPACRDCALRQDSQGISRASGFTTERHAPRWSSPDLDPVRAQNEMVRRAAGMN